MKRTVGGVLLMLLAGAAMAGSFSDSARVVEVRPAYERVVTRECGPSRVEGATGNPSDRVAGTVVGGLVGGIAGNQIGNGHGNTLATVVGALGGAALGGHLAGGESGSRVRDCEDVVRQRSVGYDVTYDYRGTLETYRTSRDPGVGARVPVRVSVSPDY